MESKKARLDQLLDIYKAQPVGKGYLDIIVNREKYKEFVEAILSEGFTVNVISWWEYCDSLTKNNKYGMGGPQSKYYDGWFAEMGVFDDVDLKKSKEEIKNDIINIIENKVIVFGKETISFHSYDLLTPAFWLVVPKGWENIQK
jgi:hypothetical protein